MDILLSNLVLTKKIFCSDHASNYLVLKGILGKDKERLVQEVRSALSSPQNSVLRQEWHEVCDVKQQLMHY
jgi:hypothetical protein